MKVDDSSRGPLFGQRHILVIMSSLGWIVHFSTRMSLPIALLSMIDSNSTSLSALNSSEEDQKPFKTFHWSSQLRGLILSSFYWGYIIFPIPAGHITQKYGGKWFVASGILWLSCLTLLVPFVASISPFALMAIFVLEGLGCCFIPQGIVAMFSHWIPLEENSSLTAITWSGAYVGTIVGQLSSGFICESPAMGFWPTVFYINGATGIIWFFFWILLVSNSPDNHSRITEDEKLYINSAVNGKRNQADSQNVPWRRILLHRSFLIYLLLQFIFGWLSLSFALCYAQYMNEILLQKASTTGVFLCLPIITVAIMAIVYTRLVDFMRSKSWISLITGRKCFTFWGFGGSGLLIFCVTLVNYNVLSTEILFIGAFGMFAAIYAGYYNTPLDKYPHYCSIIYGFGSFFSTLAGLISTIVIGHLASDHSKHGWSLVLYMTSGMAFSGAVIYVIFETSEEFQFETSSTTDSEEKLPLNKDNDTSQSTYLESLRQFFGKYEK